MAKRISINIPCGYELTLTTDVNSSGKYFYIGNPGDPNETTDGGDVNASSTVTVGPFNEDRFYEIMSITGEIQRALQFSGNYTAIDEAAATAGGGGGSFNIALNMILR